MQAGVDVQALVREINEALIMAVLRVGPKHGYQVALDVEERTAGTFAFKHGTLYPILHRLEKDGLIRGAWEEGDGRRRKEYELTVAGRRGLADRTDRLGAVLGTLLSVLGEVP